MGYAEYLQKTIDHIEENLTKPISIEECADVAGFSKFHFHRLFAMVVGLPVMEYIRKRRLCHAMADLLQGRRIIDIAMKYGYGSERTFSRAFRQEFGRLPSSCRSGTYSIPPKPVLAAILNPLYGGFSMDYLSEVRIGMLDSMTVASASRVSPTPEDDVMAYMTEWGQKAGIGPDVRNFGFDIPITEEEQSRGLRGYEYWISVAKDIALPDDVTLKHVEEGKYAILRITDPFIDPFERIPLGWKKLAGWVNSKGYKSTCSKERYWLEEVLETDGTTVMDIYFPVD